MLVNLKNRSGRRYFIIFISLVGIFLISQLTLASGADLGTNAFAATGLNPNLNPYSLIVNIINILLGFLGLVAVILVIYAGWLWMTSQGDPGQIDKAKKTLINATIGIVIIIASFGIVNYFFNAITGGYGGSGGGPGGGGGSGGVPTSGNSIIEMHYPERNQRGVARNTSIIITFKEDIVLSDLIDDTTGNGTFGDFTDVNGDGIFNQGEPYDKLNPSKVLIYKTTEGSAPATNVADVMVSQLNNRTFRFKPENFLGSQIDETWYTVALTSDIFKQNGDLAFAGAVGSVGYKWDFEVSTEIDLTPPRVTSVIPDPDSLEYKNVIIQVNFNEAINPISASGDTSVFDNMVITNVSTASLVIGQFYISNGYRTVEFLSDNPCGVNTCGEVIYCLPAPVDIEALVKAATLAVPGEATAVFPYNGVVDMADNSLDGNSDGDAIGPTMPPYSLNAPDPLTQGDSLLWRFATKDEIMASAPEILSTEPLYSAMAIDANFSPKAFFNRRLSATSLTKNSVPALNGSVALYPEIAASEVPFWLRSYNVGASTTVEIRHDAFVENTIYTPEFNAKVKDIYQNCFRPSSGTDGTAGNCVTDIVNLYCCNGVAQPLSCD